MGKSLLHFLKQHLSASVDWVYLCGYEKGPFILVLFKWYFPLMKGAHLQENMVVTDVSHSPLLIELGPICNSMAASM